MIIPINCSTRAPARSNQTHTSSVKARACSHRGGRSSWRKMMGSPQELTLKWWAAGPPSVMVWARPVEIGPAHHRLEDKVRLLRMWRRKNGTTSSSRPPLPLVILHILEGEIVLEWAYLYWENWGVGRGGRGGWSSESVLSHGPTT